MRVAHVRGGAERGGAGQGVAGVVPEEVRGEPAREACCALIDGYVLWSVGCNTHRRLDPPQHHSPPYHTQPKNAPDTRTGPPLASLSLISTANLVGGTPLTSSKVQVFMSSLWISTGSPTTCDGESVDWGGGEFGAFGACRPFVPPGSDRAVPNPPSARANHGAIKQ